MFLYQKLLKLVGSATPTTKLLEPHISLSTTRTFAYDNIIPPLLFQHIQQEAHAVHTYAATNTNATQSTWWYDPTQPPRCAIEQAIGSLAKQFKFVTNNTNDDSTGSNDHTRVTGAEWWVQHRNSTTPQFFHFDTDVGKHSSTNNDALLRCPSLSSILYLTETGGPTVILAQRPQVSNWTGRLVLTPPEATECDIMYPRKNRYCLFRGDMLHGVLPSEDNAMRTTLLVNWWTGDRPMSPACSNPTPLLLSSLTSVTKVDGLENKDTVPEAAKAVVVVPVLMEETDLQTGGKIFGPGQVPCAKLSFDVDLSLDQETENNRTVSTSAYFPNILLEGEEQDHPDGSVENLILQQKSDVGHCITGMGRIRLIENQLA
jgi:hypothetical protein